MKKNKNKNTHTIKGMNNAYEKSKNQIVKQKEKAAKNIQHQQEKIQKQEDKLKQQQEKLQKFKQQESAKRRKALEKIREQEKKKFLKQQEKLQKEREKREKVLENFREQEKNKFLKQQAKENKQRLEKEIKQWEKEITQEEKRQAKVLDELRWKGSKKKFRNIRNKLQNKLKKIQKQGKNLRPRLVSEAIRKNTSKWSINGENFKDPRVFLDVTTPTVERLINSTDSVGKKVNTVLVCKMVRSDPVTSENTITITHFRSKTHSIISEEDTTTEYRVMKEKMLESLAEYQKLGSGWRLQSVEELEIFITKYKPLNGRSYKPLPKAIMDKKAIINMENDDNKCFMWAVTRDLNTVDKNPTRISKALKIQAEKLNWKGVEFPMKVNNIYKFERTNEINVNVFSYDNETKKVYPLRLSKTAYDKCVNLFFYNEHYSVVKSLSKLVSSQLSKNAHKKTYLH